MKSAGKNKTRTTLRITKKNFQAHDFSHELFQTTNQKLKTFVRNMLTGIKLSKVQLFKINQSGEFGSAIQRCVNEE